MASRHSAWVIAWWALSACSAGGDAEGDRSGPSGGGSGPTTGSEPGEPASEPGGFGNPTATVPTAPTARPDAGGDNTGTAGGAPCVSGMFCAPSGPDPDDCGSLSLDPDVEVTRTPGNMLVIFDQSGSMDAAWSNGASKLQAAQNALVQAVTPLQDLLTIGAIFFPTLACLPGLPPPAGGAVQPITGANQIPFQPGPQFLTAWQNHWGTRSGLNLGTPMQEAFDRADVAISSASLSGPLIVVAFTDGEPNCFPDPAITMVPTMTEPERAAGWLASSSIKTYMVGLPGGAGVQILNQVAMSGGTMQYIIPDDPKMLEDKLREVVMETIDVGYDSCVITLTPAAELPDKLHLVVEENGVLQDVPRDLSADAGWTVTPDGATVELTGRLCEDAMAGRFTKVTFEYGCVELPPLPPPPPVE